MLCLHRILPNNWVCSYRILILNEELRRKMKNLVFNLKHISCTRFPKYMSHDTESSRKIPFEGVETSTIENNSSTTESQLEEPTQPTTCCMSGCANCVWIQYAEELSKRYKDGGEKAREAIMNISDPNMKAFLLTELKSIKTE